MAYSIAFNTTENELQSETMLCRKLFFHDGKGVHAVYGAAAPMHSVYAFTVVEKQFTA